MSTADELQKYKELLDQGVLTQAEFDQKKQSLLGTPPAAQKKPKKKGAWKKVVIVLAALVAVAAGAAGVRAWNRHTQEQKRIAAVDEHIAPILQSYGLDEYKIRSVGVITKIECEDFEDLADLYKMNLLKELNGQDDIPDPVDEGDTISMDSHQIFTTSSQAAYYYYISESTYNTRRIMRDVQGIKNVNVELPGLYYAGTRIHSD